MIETAKDLRQFELENLTGDWIVQVIPADYSVHVMATKRCVLFIRNLSTSKTYYFSFCHPDSIPSVSVKDVLAILTKLPNQKWALDKKIVDQLLPMSNVLDANLASYMTDNSTLDLDDYDTISHQMIRRAASGHRQINQVIPLLKLKESFDDLADEIFNSIRHFSVDSPFLSFNHFIIKTLGRIEEQGIYVNREKFKAHFDTEVGDDGLTYSQYNVYTATGRPSNRFGGINYAALNQTDGSRSCFESRYGKDGRIVVIDYTAFHPRIICTLTKYDIDIKIDIYEYLARLYFQKKNVDETDVSNSKQLTFRQLYGGVEEKYSHIRYLANLKTFINEQWELFQKLGYVETPLFKRKITENHIQDPNPSKVFNYILQAVEGEIAIPRIHTVLDYLDRHNKKSKAILYTYDAMLYDFHKDDGLDTLSEIRSIMSVGGKFPMKTYIGKTYQDVKLITM